MMVSQSNLSLEQEIKKNKATNIKLAIANTQLAELALVDELTKLPNRRGFYAFIENTIANTHEPQVLSAIMIDVDYFKQYNDFYGHESGDKALILLANHLRDSLTSADQIAVRWGGEEFIYAAFNTSKEAIIEIANSIRLKILDLGIPNHIQTSNPRLTISMGTCTAHIASMEDVDQTINRADKALYQAKENGRNAVATSEEAGTS